MPTPKNMPSIKEPQATGVAPIIGLCDANLHKNLHISPFPFPLYLKIPQNPKDQISMDAVKEYAPNNRKPISNRLHPLYEHRNEDSFRLVVMKNPYGLFFISMGGCATPLSGVAQPPLLVY